MQGQLKLLFFPKLSFIFSQELHQSCERHIIITKNPLVRPKICSLLTNSLPKMSQVLEIGSCLTVVFDENTLLKKYSLYIKKKIYENGFHSWFWHLQFLIPPYLWQFPFKTLEFFSLGHTVTPKSHDQTLFFPENWFLPPILKKVESKFLFPHFWQKKKGIKPTRYLLSVKTDWMFDKIPALCHHTN